MDTFIKAMEGRGHSVKPLRHGFRPQQTAVIVRDQWTWFRIYEEKSKLAFGLDGRVFGRKNWRDGKRQRLEDQLYEIAVIVLRVSREKHQCRIRQRQEERIQQEAERIRREQMRKEREEQQWLEGLEIQVANWVKSCQIREYLDQLEKRCWKLYGKIEHGSELDRWLIWGRRYADRIDPLMPAEA